MSGPSFRVSELIEGKYQNYQLEKVFWWQGRVVFCLIIVLLLALVCPKSNIRSFLLSFWADRGTQLCQARSRRGPRSSTINFNLCFRQTWVRSKEGVDTIIRTHPTKLPTPSYIHVYCVLLWLFPIITITTCFLMKVQYNSKIVC